MGLVQVVYIASGTALHVHFQEMFRACSHQAAIGQRFKPFCSPVVYNIVLSGEQSFDAEGGAQKPAQMANSTSILYSNETLLSISHFLMKNRLSPERVHTLLVSNREKKCVFQHVNISIEKPPSDITVPIYIYIYIK